MRIRFDAGLAWLEALAEGPDEVEGMLDGSVAEDGPSLLVARFERPVLVTDPHRIAQLPPRRRDLAQALFGLPRRVVEYDGVALDFDQARYPRVWSPSIDTLLVCRAVRALLPTLGPVRAGLEIGCGSGFLALHMMESLARAGAPLDEVHVIDIDPLAVQCAMGALEARSGRTVVSGSLGRRGEALRVRGRYDLVLMNPPYIRRPPALADERARDNPWEGVALIREVAERGAAFLAPGGSFVIVVSSLCDDLVMPWLEAAFEVTELDAMEVPLKVYAVTSELTAKSRAWMEFLTRAEGLRRYDPPREGYDLWQRLRVLRCRAR
jgi:methylase of polypeptide subunit release factors